MSRAASMQCSSIRYAAWHRRTCNRCVLKTFRISSNRSRRDTHGFRITHAHVNLEHYTRRETGRQRGVRVKGSQTIGSRGVGARSDHRWFVDGGSTRAAMVGEERRRSGDSDAV